MGKVISILLFQPPENPTRLSSKKYFWLTTSKGNKIPAFYIQQNHARFTVLYSHGNAEDLGMIYDFLKQLSQVLYINILAYDYSGYGLGSIRKDNVENEVEPSEENCYADIEAAYQYLTEEIHLSLSQIILYGRSVGSGPSCYLAKKLSDNGESVAGLILHSPFLSVCRVVIDLGFELKNDIFPNVSRIKDVGCPTFIIHGTEDEIVPFRHGKGLYEKLPEEIRYQPFWAEKMAHNNIEVQMSSVFIKRLQKFFLNVQKRQRSEEQIEGALTKFGLYTTLENKMEFSSSGDDERIARSRSEDGTSTKNLWKKRLPSSFSRSKSERRHKVSIVDDEDRCPPASTERFKALVPLSRTVAPKIGE